MNQQETLQALFEQTAAKAEIQAKKNITLYKFKLLLFGVLGYFVIFATLAILVIIVSGLVFISIKSTAILLLLLKKKLIFVLIPLLWVLFSALWVRLEPPTGHKLLRRDYPKLFEVIDELSNKLDAPKIHEVILTGEFNAAIAQTPRLGIFGWNRNTLILGLELLLVLSPQQAASVIGHELGHLSGNHSRFNGWIYRVRRSWDHIMHAFEQKNGFGANIMAGFFNWYAPKFAAYSFALARSNEYEADAIAAEVTDRKTAADALVNVHVSAPYVDENYWQAFTQAADSRPTPAQLPWAGLSQFLSTDEQAPAGVKKRLEEVLQHETNFADTHPALRDRLAALNVDAALPGRSATTAAAAWFDTKYDEILSRFDQDWSEHALPKWKARYEYVVDATATLQTLTEKRDDELNDDELWQKARLIEEFKSEEAAEVAYRAVQAREPEHASAAFCLGRLCYERDDDETVRQMKIAMNDTDLALDACGYVYHYLTSRERADEATWWSDRANKIQQQKQAEYERYTTLNKKDEMIPAELKTDVFDALAGMLHESGKVKKAWIAQRKMGENEPYTLLIAVKVNGLFHIEESIIEKINEHLNLDCITFVLPYMGESKALAKKVIKLGEQIIY